jgi:hypothetical protein
MATKTAAAIIRKTWAGPFSAGPLSHPVTVGDALLKLFQTIWRAGVVILASGCIVLSAVWVSVQLQPAPLGSKITSSARVDVRTCGTDRPLLVTFHNGNSVAIQDIAFDFTAREDGRSSNLVRSQFLHSDAIVAAGKTATLCWPMPALERVELGMKVTYGVDISYASSDPA